MKFNCEYLEDINVKDVYGCGNLYFDQGFCQPEGCEYADIVFEGDQPPLTQPQKDEILAAHRIHCGKVSRCSICGHPLPPVKGCHACTVCGSSVGNCG